MYAAVFECVDELDGVDAVEVVENDFAQVIALFFFGFQKAVGEFPFFLDDEARDFAVHFDVVHQLFDVGVKNGAQQREHSRQIRFFLVAVMGIVFHPFGTVEGKLQNGLRGGIGRNLGVQIHEQPAQELVAAQQGNNLRDRFDGGTERLLVVEEFDQFVREVGTLFDEHLDLVRFGIVFDETDQLQDDEMGHLFVAVNLDHLGLVQMVALKIIKPDLAAFVVFFFSLDLFGEELDSAAAEFGHHRFDVGSFGGDDVDFDDMDVFHERGEFFDHPDAAVEIVDRDGIPFAMVRFDPVDHFVVQFDRLEQFEYEPFLIQNVDNPGRQHLLVDIDKRDAGFSQQLVDIEIGEGVDDDLRGRFHVTGKFRNSVGGIAKQQLISEYISLVAENLLFGQIQFTQKRFLFRLPDGRSVYS